MGTKAAYFAAGFHGRYHLWPRHTGNAQKLNLVKGDRRQDGGGRILFQVAINNPVFLAAFQDRRKRQDGKWKAAVARLGGSRVEKDDHFTTLAE
jgi:hypothetical protein